MSFSLLIKNACDKEESNFAVGHKMAGHKTSSQILSKWLICEALCGEVGKVTGQSDATLTPPQMKFF